MPATPQTALDRDLRHAGYYPELVADVLGVALGGEPVVAHLVQPETTFDGEQVRRHLTALVLTPSRLIVAHVDDNLSDSEHPSSGATATTEAVPLRELRSVGLTHVVADPQRGGGKRTELVLALGWGAVSRIDLEPAGCDDPQCEADHGLTGTMVPDDVVVRISAAAEGGAAVRAAADFAQALSAATATR